MDEKSFLVKGVDSNFTCTLEKMYTNSVEQAPWFLNNMLCSRVLLGISTKQVTKMAKLMEEVIVGLFLLAAFPDMDALMGD
ncbi:hypothetical protein llap_985 [Limosa lapponica baueri]|uniref:Uncharacterized protein n=1 Tax=Limosa lapponica baueri TaxID=1758121 RepID=A0A2I0URI9_LIMLA|nr:hypothetical protein llap_985 [Limosa lapponica baueri]